MISRDKFMAGGAGHAGILSRKRRATVQVIAKSPGHGPFADPGRSPEKIGMTQAPTGDCPAQHFFCFRLAKYRIDSEKIFGGQNYLQRFFCLGSISSSGSSGEPSGAVSPPLTKRNLSRLR